MTPASTDSPGSQPSPRAASFGALAARAFGMLALLAVITGILYPLAVTAVAAAAFSDKANGSLVVKDDNVLGSRLIGQPFEDPKYFWSRPSATTPFAYNARASAGSNLGPTNATLTENAKARIDALHAVDPENTAPVPVDLVTSSGSGLDPHISPAAAEYQVRRVARARGLEVARVRALIHAHTEKPLIGIFGEPRVNVLLLNLALDRER